MKLKTKWDPDNLHRHPDYASVKKETVDNLGQQPGYTYMNQGIAAGGNEPKPIDDSDLSKCNYPALKPQTKLIFSYMR